ncbi:histone-lysine N-methyltransferase PRDM9-like [Diorhabda sublineata]|uniref:histone-lysine N-methyltransferase PRDM9-like n=1 Tax=Diorhabda sublineata TaxID=1163346 RepID=UPI0024E049DB|nr:histone-lysine N-methyltransferase PRDM9-like [Diorhabda sublineata]
MKRTYLQMTRNYVDIPDYWEDNPMPKPDFMREKNKKLLVPKQLKHKSVTDITLRKYPKRNVSAKNYFEEEETTIDRYVFCDNCEEDYLDYCSKCGMLVILKDNPVPMGVEMRAIKTVPKGILEVRPSKIHGLGVFALKIVQKGIRMGPYQGKATKLDTFKGYAWKLRDGYLIDGSDEKYSNYLRYVNCARNVSEQNLIAYQYKRELYYRTSKDIFPGEELLIYYGNSFAKNLGINTKSYFEPIEQIDEIASFSCKYCHIGFTNGGYRDNHEVKCKFNPVRTRKVDEFFICKYCECGLTSKEYLEQHEKYCRRRFEGKKKVEDVEDKKKHKCTYCDYMSKSKSYLKRHVLSKHEKENMNEIFYCNICRYKGYFKNNLKNHSKIHEASRFLCVECKIVYRTKLGLDNHFVTKHPNKVKILTRKIFQCEYCAFKTVIKSSLEYHKCIKKLEKQMDIKKENLCTKCNYSTNRKGDLNKHLRIHNNEKPFKCQLCQTFYMRKRDMDAHILNKHKNNLILMQSITYKIHKCQICFYQTVNKTNLKCHLKTHLKTKTHI